MHVGTCMAHGPLLVGLLHGSGYRHVTASGLPGCLPNDNPVESYHAMLIRMKMLAYRASTLTFLNVTWPRLLYLASMDLCSPPKRKLEVVSSASLKGGLALLEAFGADGAPVYTVYSHTTHDDKPDEEGAYSVYLLNDTLHMKVPITDARVPPAPLQPTCPHLPPSTTHPHRPRGTSSL